MWVLFSLNGSPECRKFSNFQVCAAEQERHLYTSCLRDGTALMRWKYHERSRHTSSHLKAAQSSDMNQSEWQIEGTCSYRCYTAMTSSVSATRLMKTDWRAAAERISQPHEQRNNDVTIADVEVVFLHLKQAPVESGHDIMTEWCALFTPF